LLAATATAGNNKILDGAACAYSKGAASGKGMYSVIDAINRHVIDSAARSNNSALRNYLLI
jgi:hypothetical protein